MDIPVAPQTAPQNAGSIPKGWFSKVEIYFSKAYSIIIIVFVYVNALQY